MIGVSPGGRTVERDGKIYWERIPSVSPEQVFELVAKGESDPEIDPQVQKLIAEEDEGGVYPPDEAD